MMNEYEVQVYIDNHLAGIEHHYTNQSKIHLYENLKDMTTYLKLKVTIEEWTTVRKIFDTAAYLYERGNRMVKATIENTFVFAFSSLMPADRQKRLKLHSIIPCSLYSAYIQQMLRSGN